MAETLSVLNSWKEIAFYLGRGVRTVQRWHDILRLPVHRIGDNPKGPVFAYKSELDRWMQKQARQSSAGNIDRRLGTIKDDGKNQSAIRERLELWTKLNQRRQSNFARTRQLGFEFMRTDLDAALTLVSIAERAKDGRKRIRNEANARRALKTVLELYRASKLTDSERRLLKRKIAVVRVALERLRPSK